MISCLMIVIMSIYIPDLQNITKIILLPCIVVQTSSIFSFTCSHTVLMLLQNRDLIFHYRHNFGKYIVTDSQQGTTNDYNNRCHVAIG